jgi:hypothetical protein
MPFTARIALAIIYGLSGREQDARDEAEEVPGLEDKFLL